MRNLTEIDEEGADLVIHSLQVLDLLQNIVFFPTRLRNALKCVRRRKRFNRSSGNRNDAVCCSQFGPKTWPNGSCLSYNITFVCQICYLKPILNK